MLKKLIFFYLLLIASFLCSQINAGVIVLLNGTGSAGKSSVGRELAQMLGNTEFVNEELVIYNVFNAVFKKYGLPEQESFEQTISYLTSLSPDSPTNKALKAETDSWANLAELPLDTELFRLVINFASGGKNVIVDNPMWKSTELELWKEKTKKFPSLHVVVYCPPDKLIDHIIDRNAHAQKTEHRSFDEPLDMFMKMYQPQPSTHAASIDSLEQSQVKSALKKAVIEAQKSDDESDKLVTDDFAQAFLKRFGLESHDTTRITPVFDYDLAVNTGSQTPRICAEQIISKLPKSSSIERSKKGFYAMSLVTIATALVVISAHLKRR